MYEARSLSFAAAATFSLAFWGLPARSMPTVESMPSGNYRFCVNPPSQEIEPDGFRSDFGPCFLFQKTGDRVVGIYLFSENDDACVSGSVRGNVVRGEANYKGVDSYRTRREHMPGFTVDLSYFYQYKLGDGAAS